ncbi:Sapep family Mn(2+)-dependent dipeptidase [Candidatus Sumerlaeota bacterium]|nr:Sapep family Mn(2+)-dependent dipeptidase [Candidatus Sumerlaeota bacterium]
MASVTTYYRRLIEQELENLRDEMVENLTRLLMFCTVSGPTNEDERRLYLNELSRGFSFLHGLARQMDFSWRSYDNRVCVIEQTGGPEVVGLPLHIDVVPSGEGWHYPAFGGMIEDGVIYGRGAQDNKGPIVEMLYAVHVLKRLGLKFRRTVRLIIASQEETGDWSDVKAYFKREPAPHFSIVSDSEFPIINGEKGMIDLKIDIHWNEPLKQHPSLAFLNFRGGERPNIVPNRADIAWMVGEGQAQGVATTLKRTLEDFLKSHPEADAFPLRIDREQESGHKPLHISFLGRSIHSSTPEGGHNAVIDALRFLQEVPEIAPKLAEVARFLSESFADIYGKGIGIDGKHSFLGETTSSLDVLEIDENGARAIVNVRQTYGATAREILKKVRQRVAHWAEQSGMKAEVQFNCDPHEALYVDPKKNAELIGSLRKAFAEVTGCEASLVARGGTTFAKAFPNAVSFGPVLPSQEKNLMHQADECLDIRHFLRNTCIFALAIMLLATEHESMAPGGETSAGSVDLSEAETLVSPPLDREPPEDEADTLESRLNPGGTGE